MSDVIATKSVEHPPPPPRPTITLPPRSSFESFLTSGSFPGFSPGPMTLVSNFFSDPDNRSFSQLLAGAMASPIIKPETFSSFADNTEPGSGSGAQKVGYKQNRPVGLVVAQSPLFMVPPGLTPSSLLNSPGFLSPLQSPFGMSHQQALAHVTAQAALSQSYKQVRANFQQSSSEAPSEASHDQSFSLADDVLPDICQSDRKTAVASVEKLEFDGYNWRKYGQKQVKASEYPRSYYKCTHVGCLVKKKVERSRDGHVTEITYKGQHNHGPRVNPRHGSQDQTGSIKYSPTFLAPEDVQLSSQPSEHDQLQVISVPVNDNDNNSDQPKPKRRCMEKAGASGHTTRKTVTESRLIVQTRSEVDLLNDGYKWRKYGQKVVKGNPYPRSYYRCTHPECNVRKHVERSSTDPKNVITTYEGNHTHVIPAAKNSGSNTPRSINSLQLTSQDMNGKPMDFESKDQIPVLPRAKEGEMAT